MKKQRKFLPSLNTLVDRLSIHQLKEVFLTENKENYSIVEIKGKYLPHLILNKTQLKSIA